MVDGVCAGEIDDTIQVGLLASKFISLEYRVWRFYGSVIDSRGADLSNRVMQRRLRLRKAAVTISRQAALVGFAAMWGHVGTCQQL